MTEFDLAVEQYGFWCAEGLSTAEMVQALDGEAWLFADAQPSPSYVVSRIQTAGRCLAVVTLWEWRRHG